MRNVTLESGPFDRCVRRKGFVKTLLLLLLSACRLCAQNAVYVDLSGDWRESADDKPEYAGPHFDDTAWKTVRLPWTEQPPTDDSRHWFRRTVEIPPGADRTRLALALGPISSVYEVYVNGVRIGSTGPFADDSQVQVARTRVFPMPPLALGSGGQITVAVRTRMVLLQSIEAADIYFGGRYLLTYIEHAPLGAARNDIDRQKVRYSQSFAFAELELLLALILGLLWLSEQEREELFWLGLLVACRGITEVYLTTLISLDSLPLVMLVTPFWWLVNSALGLAALAELVLAVSSLTSRWVRVLIWGKAILSVFGFALPMVWREAPELGLVFFTWIYGAARSRQLRYDSARNLNLLIIGFLCLARMDSGGLGLLPAFFNIGGQRWSKQSLTTTLFATILAILSLRRLMADRREKQRLGRELEAARLVQQLLLKNSGSGAIDTFYQPAQEVGGDFYQVFPLSDGSELLAVGDVSGKGLKAAMVVSLLTGALRNRKSDAPGELLGELNRTVCGGLDGGFVTAAVARCYPNGRIVLANAGNPSPYLGGEEITPEAGLPLGIVSDAEYPETEFALGEERQLTFVSDGVIEAANVKGELFSFDRTCGISTKSAQEIAGAAKAWGQNDDITVVTVRRAG